MPHTELSLATILRDELLDTATVLGWTDPLHPAYATAIRRTLRMVAASILDVVPMPQAEAAATVQIWQSVVNTTAMAINFQADGARYDREAIHKNAVLTLARLKAEYAQQYSVASEQSPISSVLATYARW